MSRPALLPRGASSLGRSLGQWLLARAAGPVDDRPVDGGLGRHPLGPPRTWSPAEEASPLLRALASGDTDGLHALLQNAPVRQGVAQVSEELVHMAVAWVWMPPPGPAALALAGRARGHMGWLQARALQARPPGEAELATSALLIAALTWPAIPRSRNLGGRCLASLGRSLPALLARPEAALEPPALVRALWCAWLARAWARAGGLAFPLAATGALVMGADLAWRIAGPQGALPGSPVRPLLPLAGGSLPARLQALAWCEGLSGEPGPQPDDPVARLLSLRNPPPTEASPPLDDKAWALWSWRELEAHVGWRTLRRAPSRTWITGQDSGLEWSWGEDLLLRGVGAPARTVRARVDGQAMTVELEGSGHSRRIRLRQARATITDRGLDQASWQLDPSWAFEADDKGFVGTRGRARLEVRTDPAWAWRLDDRGRLQGQGPRQELKLRVELR